jgi:glycosyltransferase involved in cell wall biosynthesis
VTTGGPAEQGYAVVVPTLGRPTLAAAVLSTITQHPRPREIVVVVDGTDPAVVPDYLTDFPEMRVLTTGGSRGPSTARMMGVAVCRAPLVAFLDDDDEWLPGKMAAQLELFSALRAHAPYPVVSCRAYLTYHGRVTSQIGPTEPLRDGETLLDYMFVRRHVIPQGFKLGSSSLLAPRALLEAEPWDERLHLHEDWEWLVRVSRRDDVHVAMHPAPLISYTKSGAGHASRPRGAWRVSVEFAERIGLGARNRGDFLLAAAGNSVTLRDRAESVRAAACVWRTAEAGTAAWLVFLLRLTLPDPVLRAAVPLVRAARSAVTLGRPSSGGASRLVTSNRLRLPLPGRADQRHGGAPEKATHGTNSVLKIEEIPSEISINHQFGGTYFGDFALRCHYTRATQPHVLPSPEQPTKRMGSVHSGPYPPVVTLR